MKPLEAFCWLFRFTGGCGRTGLPGLAIRGCDRSRRSLGCVQSSGPQPAGGKDRRYSCFSGRQDLHPDRQTFARVLS